MKKVDFEKKQRSITKTTTPLFL